MGYWPKFSLHDRLYNTDHLDALDLIVTQPSNGKDPARDFQLRIKFSHHLFTDPKSPTALYIGDSRGKDVRPVCLSRYLLSFMASEMMRNVGIKYKHCYFAKNRNYMVFRLLEHYCIETRQPLQEELHVYFRPRRYKKIDGWLELYVESAYPKRVEQGQKRKHLKRISIFKLFDKTLKGEKIKKPR